VQALAWWLIPIVATLLAVVWVTWANRPRRPADAHDSLAAHRRFTEALARTEEGGTTTNSADPANAAEPSPDAVGEHEPDAGDPPARSA